MSKGSEKELVMTRRDRHNMESENQGGRRNNMNQKGRSRGEKSKNLDTRH